MTHIWRVLFLDPCMVRRASKESINFLKPVLPIWCNSSRLKSDFFGPQEFLILDPIVTTINYEKIMHIHFQGGHACSVKAWKDLSFGGESNIKFLTSTIDASVWKFSFHYQVKMCQVGMSLLDESPPKIRWHILCITLHFVGPAALAFPKLLDKH